MMMIAKAKPQPKAIQRLIPAVGYLRASNKKQDKSIGDQQVEIEAWAARNGYMVVRWYIDEGISGNARRRPSFEQLMADCRGVRDFETILCWKRDRFSRKDFLDTSEYWKVLRDTRVEIHSITQGPLRFDSIGDQVTALVDQYGNHEFLLNMSQNVSRGLKRVALSGRWIGRRPFGFDRNAAGFLAPNQDSQHVVDTFTWFVHEGSSLLEIARRLQRRGVGPKTWKQTYVLDMLRNWAYIGHVVYGRSASGKYSRILAGEIVMVDRQNRDKATEQHDSECIVVKNAHPATVDGDLWELAQDMIRRRQTKRRRKQSHLLTGLARCGHCGTPICGGSQVRGGKEYRRYVCQTRTSSKGMRPDCRYCVEAAGLHDVVISEVMDRLLRDDQIERLRADVVDYVTQKRREQGQVESSHRDQLASVQSQLDKAEQRLSVVPDDMLPKLYEQIRDLRDRRSRLSAELMVEARVADMTDNALADEASRLVTQLRRLRTDISSDDPAIVHGVLERVIEEIVIYTAPVPPNNKIRRLARVDITFRPDICYSMTPTASATYTRV